MGAASVTLFTRLKDHHIFNTSGRVALADSRLSPSLSRSTLARAHISSFTSGQAIAIQGRLISLVQMKMDYTKRLQ